MEGAIRLAMLSFVGAALATMTTGAQAGVSITVTGSWFEVVDETNLPGGAGGELTQTCESAPDQVQLDIQTDAGETWHIDVSREETGWQGDLTLSVRATSEGTGPGSISGVGPYRDVSVTYQQFLTGNDDRSGIPVQLKIDGVSSGTGSGTYATTVYYTITEGS
jgi:hypothetical protein